MTILSPEVKRAIEANGWQEGRRIDTTDYESALISAGYGDYQAVCEFLQQYGDLEVEASVGETCLNTLLSEIMKSTLVSYFSQEAGRTLYRIGSCYLEFMSLVMDASGRVYRYMDMTCQNTGGIDLYLIASSGEEAIEKLFWEYHGENGDIVGEWIAHLG